MVEGPITPSGSPAYREMEWWWWWWWRNKQESGIGGGELGECFPFGFWKEENPPDPRPFPWLAIPIHPQLSPPILMRAVGSRGSSQTFQIAIYTAQYIHIVAERPIYSHSQYTSFIIL
jgi:hypothetical protein